MATPEERSAFESGRGPVTMAWAEPARAKAVLVVAPGAGSDLDAPFLVGFTRAMNEASIATMRFNFPYKEAGRRGPDPSATLQTAWLAAFAEAERRAARKKLPIFVGGKSMGGRIASMCASKEIAPRGLVFLGYPLHPPGRPEKARDQHLPDIQAPMLFIEGTRDPFVQPWEQLVELIKRLKPRARLHAVEGGDHSFRVKGAKKGEPAADDRLIGASLAPVATEFIRAAI